MTTPDPKPTDDWKPGSVFEPDSAACTAALNDLAVVMKQIGFIVDKKRVSENTLRVYVRKRLTYPLLNPRFQRPPIRGLTGRGILEITALSKGDEALGRRLGAFPSSATALFRPVGSQDGRYVNHGYFAVPLSFRGAGPRRYLDVAALAPALTAIRRYLESAA
jgi:hypothetical protein